MQLGGSPSRTRPSVSVASLLVPRVYKPPGLHLGRISSSPLSSWPSWSSSSSGDEYREPLESYASRTCFVAHTCAHLHAHSWLVYVRRDIILARSKHLRDFLLESSSGSAHCRERGRDALWQRGGEGWVMVVTHSRQRRKDATSWVGRTNEVFLIDDSANYYCCYCYKGSAYLVFGLEFFSGNFRDTWRSVFFSREWFLSRSDCYLVCRSLGTTASRIFCNSFRDEDELVINRNTLTKEEDGGDKRN